MTSAPSDPAASSTSASAPTADSASSVIQRLGETIADTVERWMPSPFLFAILLTYATGIAAAASEGAGLVAIAGAWYAGFWSLLQFAMQMVLILVTACVVAYHPRVKAGIARLVRLPANGRQAVVLVGICSMLTGWISWGLGLILGAILAREMGRHAHARGMAVHYPLLAVAGYMGMSLTWGWGLSSSAGLLQATANNIFIQQGIVDRVIPATEWVFHRYPAILTVLAIAYASLMLYLLAPPGRNCRGIARYVPLDAPEDPHIAVRTHAPAPAASPRSPADRIDNSRLLGGVLAATGLLLFGGAFATQGLRALDLNVLNFGFLMIGLLLYASPSTYEREFADAVRGSAGVILLFPFYAGIVGIMTGTGLVTTLTTSLLSVATPETFAVTAWFSAAFLNLFVPSAGGEWAILGGPLLAASTALEVPYGQTIAAYSVGDAHTNLLNPFWALPLLAITGLRAREMFGYAITMMLLLTPFLALVLYLLPY